MNEETKPQSTAEVAHGKSEGKADDAETREAVGRRDYDTGEGDSRGPLLQADRTSTFSNRWQEVQSKFVDEPQEAVRQADGLVAEVIQELATTFAEQRQGLEEQWSRGSEVSTEDLRQALMQYRSFFQRLLSA